MVTVIIATRNEPLLNKTIEWLYDSAGGEIEVIVSLDEPQDVDERAVVIKNDKPVGRRVGINKAARIAKGEYLFILDAHCKMSKDWDLKMIESCPDKGMVVSSIQDMFEDGTLRPGMYQQVYMNSGYEEKWWDRKPKHYEEEMMCLTGCSWLIPTKYYWECGGYDESLGEYGWDGPEWACKVWLGFNGKVILRSDVICGHVFGTNDGGRAYPCNTIGYKKYLEYMAEKYKDKVQWLRDKFGPLPDEKVRVKETKTFTTTINKVDTVETKNLKGEVIKIVKKHYFPFHVTHDGSKSPEQVESENVDLITDVDWEETVFDGGTVTTPHPAMEGQMLRADV